LSIRELLRPSFGMRLTASNGSRNRRRMQENSNCGKDGVKMKKKLENNLALKIFALVIAVGMWLFVNNVDDPVVTARYSVKVTVQNENYVYDAGKTYQIEEDARTVTVLIRGRESVVQNRSDLVVYANLSEIQRSEERRVGKGRS